MGGLDPAEPSKARDQRRLLLAGAPCSRSRVGSSARGEPEVGVKVGPSSVANESCSALVREQSPFPHSIFWRRRPRTEEHTLLRRRCFEYVLVRSDFMATKMRTRSPIFLIPSSFSTA